MNPEIRNHPQLDPFEGFRIPQIMVPWIDWKDLLNKQQTYSRARFHNEVLARSYDSGVRPLRMDDLVRNSSNDIIMSRTPDSWRPILGRAPVFMGIDWGTGENSFTVVTLGTYLNNPATGGKFTVFYFKRYVGYEVDPEPQLKHIFELIETFKPVIIGSDYGGGFDRNLKILNRYGPKRLSRYQYIGGHQGAVNKRRKIEYDTKKGRYLVDRTEVMSDIFNAIKEDKVEFPRWSEWQEPHGQDMMSIFSEYDEINKTVKFDKPPDATDDSFHSVLYLLLASMIRFPRPDILTPGLARAA